MKAGGLSGIILVPVEDVVSSWVATGGEGNRYKAVGCMSLRQSCRFAICMYGNLIRDVGSKSTAYRQGWLRYS